MAVSRVAKRKAQSIKALEIIIKSPDSTPTAVISATKALAQIDGKEAIKHEKPVGAMTRAEIQAELTRVRALLGDTLL